jgi:hypothetical protein
MLHAVFHKLVQGLRRLWYFVMDTPSLPPDLKDKLEQMPETQAQRIRQRWERSRQRTVQR